MRCLQPPNQNIQSLEEHLGRDLASCLGRDIYWHRGVQENCTELRQCLHRHMASL